MRSEIADKTYLTKGWGYVAVFALLPYAVLKSLWAWGSNSTLSKKYRMGTLVFWKLHWSDVLISKVTALSSSYER
ncbi:hypothetical protein PAECIP111802_07074 [Paenibacillus allorhizosphaerae]|uniref:Uncharacterized protein n=1 Tax=Paenibacillus allorhizosphaerae TaxID=2849866 RepID=A0ABM8VU04_9BACL|nr:hypothetical protein PAECIP111802_07074 [Paenibacillus allorhizosphaerae]